MCGDALMELRHKHNVRGFILVKKLIAPSSSHTAFRLCFVLTQMLTREQCDGSLYLGEKVSRSLCGSGPLATCTSLG